jgi:hypothetical protein
VPGDSPSWTLLHFLDRLDAWEALESPDDDLRLIVTAWVLSRFDDPYRDVHREKGFANLWFGAVPGTEDGGTVVTCSYWIEESSRTLQCDRIASLNLPL